MHLEKLIGCLAQPQVIGGLDREITGITYDSRLVAPGHLFVATRGLQVDGHAFVEQAVDRGASAIVLERFVLSRRATQIIVPDARAALGDLAAFFYGYPSRQMRMIGITGTNGKTTVSYLTKHLLERAAQRTGLLGTVSYQIGDRVLPAQRTTPESADLQAVLAQCVSAGCRNVVMEVSSHALKLNRVQNIDFLIGVFTNLTQDHLDFHHGMKDYFEAKANLFNRLAGFGKREPVAIINVDDPYGQQLVGRLARKMSILTYGMGSRADFRSSNFKFEMTGTSFQLDVKDRSYLVRLPLIGRFNIHNALAALATAHALGHDIRSSVLALAKAPPVPGRLEPVPARRQFQIFVDYAHTEDALINVLKTCRDLQPKRLIVVFGCGGDRDRSKRSKMGAAVDQWADFAIITSDNPRTEDPLAITREVERGFQHGKYEVIVERREAIGRAIELAQPRDIVLIAGKGHEKYQEFSDHTVPFDDVEVALRALEIKPVEMK